MAILKLVSVLTDSVYLTAVTQSCIILIIMGWNSWLSLGWDFSVAFSGTVEMLVFNYRTKSRNDGSSWHHVSCSDQYVLNLPNCDVHIQFGLPQLLLRLLICLKMAESSFFFFLQEPQQHQIQRKRQICCLSVNKEVNQRSAGFTGWGDCEDVPCTRRMLWTRLWNKSTSTGPVTDPHTRMGW